LFNEIVVILLALWTVLFDWLVEGQIENNLENVEQHKAKQD
jgi:hypothetical protein